MSGHRLDGYGLVDRSKVLNFTFDGRAYQGFQGDTIASALLANGVRVLGRSFKYHRPRGVWGAWVDEPNAIMSVTLNGVELPNCLATTSPLEDGMIVRAVNAWPSAQFDIKGGLDLFHRWLGAGFYYKTFMWPDWHLFEPLIRRMAGLGAVSKDHLDGYVSDQLYDACDVLVIGGGPAGLRAARCAAETGQKVVLVEDHSHVGGTGLTMKQIDATPAKDWIADQLAKLTSAGGRVLTSTTVFGVYDHGLIGLIENAAFGVAPRLHRMRAGRVVLATGALDRPITFANNDRAGVMSAIGALDYLHRYGVLVGETAIGFINNSVADAALSDLEGAGLSITRVDPVEAEIKALGGKRLTGLSVDGTAYAADTVLASGGLTPLVHLWRHAGGKLDWSDERQAFVPGTAPRDMIAVGAANGTFDLEAALAEAKAAATGSAAERIPTDYALRPLWPKPGSKGRQWIDFQHDVTLKDVEVAARENYVSVEHLKRYTTLGMASDQGKTSNMAGLAAMASIQELSIPEVGTTTFRPPYVPVPMEAYHGHHRRQLWHPVKRLPLEPEHRALDAALGEYGGWLRPGWYGNGDPYQTVQKEVLQARQSAGVLDGSPLGKIEVMGPDAEAFVNFVYYNTIRTMKPGTIRYGFMLTEGGIVMDDGVISRLAPDRFVISCSSSHVDSVRTHLEIWRQDGNDPHRIFVHDLTMQWGTVTVTGPKARDILSTLELDIDLSRDAFPHMTFREASFNGSPLRVARVSFSGDVSFEISVPCSQVTLLWKTILEAAKAIGAGPIGIEAMSILRAEKGYLIIGKDTDGETMPHDLGFGVPRQKKKTAFIGDRGLHTKKANANNRKSLVGLAVPEGEDLLPTGAHIVPNEGRKRSMGYVTSSYDSPTLGHPIAMGLVENGADRMGETVTIWHLGRMREATICSACFFDPEGECLHA